MHSHRDRLDGSSLSTTSSNDEDARTSSKRVHLAILSRGRESLHCYYLFAAAAQLVLGVAGARRNKSETCFLYTYMFLQFNVVSGIFDLPFSSFSRLYVQLCLAQGRGSIYNAFKCFENFIKIPGDTFMVVITSDHRRWRGSSNGNGSSSSSSSSASGNATADSDLFKARTPPLLLLPPLPLARLVLHTTTCTTAAIRSCSTAAEDSLVARVQRCVRGAVGVHTQTLYTLLHVLISQVRVRIHARAVRLSRKRRVHVSRAAPCNLIPISRARATSAALEFCNLVSAKREQLVEQHGLSRLRLCVVSVTTSSHCNIINWHTRNNLSRSNSRPRILRQEFRVCTGVMPKRLHERLAEGARVACRSCEQTCLVQEAARGAVVAEARFFGKILSAAKVAAAVMDFFSIIPKLVGKQVQRSLPAKPSIYDASPAANIYIRSDDLYSVRPSLLRRLKKFQMSLDDSFATLISLLERECSNSYRKIIRIRLNTNHSHSQSFDGYTKKKKQKRTEHGRGIRSTVGMKKAQRDKSLLTHVQSVSLMVCESANISFTTRRNICTTAPVQEKNRSARSIVGEQQRQRRHNAGYIEMKVKAI
ncbi:unnamed protein product [Trichogramma brassicae]|uniref:Uncharacterized protein n=1 Tax=Trichogramma brassicae TaxID=86971 RepID=A0A6H5IPN7_9HYME|nr:unnamed protein product [Trichogramma brassicae]